MAGASRKDFLGKFTQGKGNSPRFRLGTLPCGERACPRWGAKRPQNLQSRYARDNGDYGFRVAPQPSAAVRRPDKPARHKCVFSRRGMLISISSVAPLADHSTPYAAIQFTGRWGKKTGSVPVFSFQGTASVPLPKKESPEGPTPPGPQVSIAYSLAIDTSVDFTNAITSLPICSSSSFTERVVITEVTIPEAVCTSISESTSPVTISLMVPLNWLRTLMALMVMALIPVVD